VSLSARESKGKNGKEGEQRRKKKEGEKKLLLFFSLFLRKLETEREN
jgi:hypothetical protein